ncbi:SDR family NAD(P)-dependent oxidoreductase [Salinisphaera sp. T31B1]|uniref:SDR family NAD(P)-dependent oxidoreductase n=1 Tax=Salinisphaera sp. T31B1 TaxID=727963 RepID=UPI00333FF10C
MHIQNDTTALVTGAGSGIGRALALALADRGARVICADLTAARGEQTAGAIRARSGRAEAIALDVSCLDSWTTACGHIRSTIGWVDIICNNAGTTCGKSGVGEIAFADWDRLISTNLSGVLYGSRLFLSDLYRGHGPGHILNTVSICGVVTGSGSGAYIASKFGALGLSEALYFDTLDSEVSVSVLCPGFVKTGLATQAPRGNECGEPVPRTNHAAIDNGMDPAALAAMAVRGIENEQFYLMSHPEYAAVVRSRHRQIEQALTSAERGDGRQDDVRVLAAGWAQGDMHG